MEEELKEDSLWRHIQIKKAINRINYSPRAEQIYMVVEKY